MTKHRIEDYPVTLSPRNRCYTTFCGMAKIPLHRENAIGVANDAMKLRPARLGKRFVEAANAGDEVAFRFASEIVDGSTNRLLREVDDLIADFSIKTSPKYRPSKRSFTWYEHLNPPKLPGKDWAYGLVVVQLTNANILERIKRCEADDCDLFFFGDPRKRWCSKTCGSRQRVREMREARRT